MLLIRFVTQLFNKKKKVMSLFKTEIKPEEATGKIAEAYEFFKERLGKVPKVMQLHTVNPILFGNLVEFLGYYGSQSKLDIEMLAHIRLIVSAKGNCEYCVKLNSAILIQMGKQQAYLDNIANDCKKIEIDEKRKQLVLFALKVVFNAEDVNVEDLTTLKDLGWTEKDIYDASAAATKQHGMIQLIKAFKVEIDF